MITFHEKVIHIERAMTIPHSNLTIQKETATAFFHIGNDAISLNRNNRGS